MLHGYLNNSANQKLLVNLLVANSDLYLARSAIIARPRVYSVFQSRMNIICRYDVSRLVAKSNARASGTAS